MIKRIKENKMLLYLGAVIIGLLILLVVRITYGYLAAEINSAKEDIVITSDAVDEFKLIEGNPLSINATSTTLPEDGNNLVVESKPKVTLKANGTNNKATYTYYVYLDLNSSLIYTSEDNTPEVMLTVIDPSGTEINNINGLEYGTTNGVSGFDVTIYSGKLTLASEYTIESTSSTTATEQAWTIRLTYLNLSTDQSANYGKNITTKLTVSKDAAPETLADHIKGLYTTNGVNNLYLHDSNLANSAEDGSLRYAGSSDTTNNFVCFGSDEETCPNDDLYRIIGVFGDQVKLIKSDYANSNMLGTDGYYSEDTWAKSSSSSYKGSYEIINRYYISIKTSDKFETTLLNKTNLNTNYITYLNNRNAKWINMIDDTKWNIGVRSAGDVIAKNIYNAERANQTTESSKIGLMYISDYMYAASPTYWTYQYYHISDAKQDYRAAKDANWIYMGLVEWTTMLDSNFRYYVNSTGNIGSNNGVYCYAARPVLYLKADVEFVKGTGLASDPFRLK